MVELRTIPSKKAPNGKLDGKWDPKAHTVTIRNVQLGIDTTYFLDDETGTMTVISSVSVNKVA